MSSVDLSIFRNITDGDQEIELELFSEFISSSKKLIYTLEHECFASADKEKWRETSHALKGISGVLGAYPLSKLCEKSQKNYEEFVDHKGEFLIEIKEEYGKVIEFLQEEMK